MAVARSAARRARVAKDAIVANAAIVAIAAVRPSVDRASLVVFRAAPARGRFLPQALRAIGRRAAPKRTRRSSRTAPSARSPCCSAAAASPEAGRRRIPTSVSRFRLRPARLIGLAMKRRLAGAFSCGRSQAVSSGRQQRWQVGQAGRDGGAACVQAGKQAFEMADVRHRTVEQHAVAELDQQGGKFSTSSSPSSSACSSISIQANTRSGMASASASSGLVLLAGVAPGGAETGDEPGVGRRAQARAQGGNIGTGNE